MAIRVSCLVPIRRRSGSMLLVIDVAGVENTVLCSDLGLTGSPRPIDGYREIVGHLLDLQFTEAEIKRLTGGHAAELLGLEA